ncbi:hypothetical protein ACTFIT_012121 [Dictyostelium discoideum]
MDNNYNKYCSGQLKIISDFDKIQEIFGIVLKNHANNQGTKDIKNFRILDNGCSHVYHLNSYSNKINNTFTYGIGNGFENQIVPDNSIDFIFSFTTFHWVPFINHRLPGLENYYKERLLNVLNNRYNELKVGGIFSFNILIQDNQGSENEEKSKSGYCMIKANQILREMSYESIISREEVENMIIPIVHLTRDEYQYAIDKSTNNTDDESYIGSIISIIGNSIKSSINGDTSRVDSIFNDFKQRLHLKYKLNPNDFQFHVCNLYLSFLKEN